MVTNPFTGQSITTNKWSDSARRKSAEARKRKALSSTQKGALIGAGVAGGSNALLQGVHHLGTSAMVDSLPHGVPRELERSLFKIPMKSRLAGLGAALAVGGLAGAGIGKFFSRKKKKSA